MKNTIYTLWRRGYDTFYTVLGRSTVARNADESDGFPTLIGGTAPTEPSMGLGNQER